MSEETTKPGIQTPSNGSPKPAWWTDSLETSWNKVRAEVLADWRKFVEAEKILQHRADEQALAFGHGARAAYEKLQVWGEELEDKLKADWKATSADAESAWDQVRAVVKRGWERAAAAAPPPAPVDKPLPSSRP